MKMTHHATLVRATSVSTVNFPELEKECEIQDQYFVRFGIDDARELVRMAYQRPAETGEQMLVVRTDFITLEAQNALLKILEEPPVSTRLTFIVPHGFSILPTLASRFGQESSLDEGEDESIGLFQDFLKQSYGERLAAIEQSVKKKDTDWQRAIKRGLIDYVSASKDKSTVRSELEYVTRTLLTRGASNKMLLEHAALALKARD